MLCFHGFGMHGKQFSVLEEQFGDQYTFYGFDLFFHKQTKLKDNTLDNIKKGISKHALTQIFLDFCADQQINRFSLMAYSLGTHYASSIVESNPERVDQLVCAAPACLRPGHIVTFFSCTKIGNKIAERLTVKGKGLLKFIKLIKNIKLIDHNTYQILMQEMGTEELRFNLYACSSFLGPLKLNKPEFIDQLNTHKIKSLFIFGDRDFDYPASIAKKFAPHIKHAEFITIPANHDMINPHFSDRLKDYLI